MQPGILPSISDVIDSTPYRPCVSIVLPFEPKMTPKPELIRQLKLAIDKAEQKIRENYNNELAKLVLRKLKALSGNLNFSTFKKSIAIYISPLFEKVLYLDIPLQEKVIVNGAFEIRDLLYAKQELRQYMVLVLTG